MRQLRRPSQAQRCGTSLSLSEGNASQQRRDSTHSISRETASYYLSFSRCDRQQPAPPWNQPQPIAVRHTRREQYLRARRPLPAGTATFEQRVRALETERNERHAAIDWQFTARDVRVKLKKFYPVASPLA